LLIFGHNPSSYGVLREYEADKDRRGKTNEVLREDVFDHEENHLVVDNES
jgi:hypothetical protein